MSTLLRGPGSLALLGEAARSTNRPARGGADSWFAQLEEIWPDGGGHKRIEQPLTRHAARKGFRMTIAQEDEQLIGFAYGHVGSPGEWWHDSIEAAMTLAQRQTWLAPGHFELLELHLRPDCRRRGIGSALHDAVLEELTSQTVVASIRTNNTAALGLAGSKGYQVVLSDFRFARGDAPYCILGLARRSSKGGVTKPRRRL
ncbi:MAG TPA: GNAT family N-acetyltransferase [Gaiellaceae bacterium]|nr:GNAT family N-acetyltransferase [Gaiellaceae bacterium]